MTTKRGVPPVDVSVDAPHAMHRAHLPPGATAMLAAALGPPLPRLDADLAAVAERLPASRLPADPLLETDPAVRLRHARGESLPDWIALRSGRPGLVPDAVARPPDASAVRAVLHLAERVGAAVIPFGGGTSVVGGVTPHDPDRPSIALATSAQAALVALDEKSGLATFGAGATGPAIEAALARAGRTLGHYPQSWERSTLGGWVAARSVGQQSTGYGRIEALFAGGRLEAPAGTLVLPPFPASAAGPDLRELVLGSEGRFGVLTEVVVRTSPIAPREAFPAWFVPSWAAGIDALRELLGGRVPLSMARLSGPVETRVTLALAGRPRLTALLSRYLALRGLGPERCLFIAGVTGRERITRAAEAEAADVLRRHGAVAAPGMIGRQWAAQRFRAPDLRPPLWAAGYAVDTLETAADWTTLPALTRAIAWALRTALEPDGERVLAFGHLSHAYPTGSNLYVTYLFRIAPDPDETLRCWSVLKAAASRAIVEHGATISHQHGVGSDHLPWVAAEKGELGMEVLEAARARFDPHGVMNPGVLLPAPARPRRRGRQGPGPGVGPGSGTSA